MNKQEIDEMMFTRDEAKQLLLALQKVLIKEND
jgi:hypothetical protein